MDADGTYPIARVPDLLEEMQDAEMVVGSRTGPSVEYSKLRKFSKSFLIWYCSWITRRSIPDINSGLRVFRRSIVEKYLHILPDSFSFTTTITIAFLMGDYTVKYVPIDYSKRIGKSKIKPIRDTLRFLQLILRTGMYFAPLRACAPIILSFGVLFLASMFYDAYVYRNLTDKTLVLLMLTEFSPVCVACRCYRKQSRR